VADEPAVEVLDVEEKWKGVGRDGIMQRRVSREGE
jgi:hypothetical protein